MLYRGSDIIKEVAWVIYDEIHYMRDKGLNCLSTYVYAYQHVIQFKYNSFRCLIILSVLSLALHKHLSFVTRFTKMINHHSQKNVTLITMYDD